MNPLETTLKQLRLSGLLQTLTCACKNGRNRSPMPIFELIVRMNSTSASNATWHAAPGRRLPTPSNRWRTSIGASTLRPQKGIYDLATALHTAKPRMCSSWSARCRQNASGQPSVTRPSARTSWCSTAPSSIWSGDFLKDEAFNQQDKTLRKYLQTDLVIIDDMGLKQLPNTRRVFARSHHAPYRKTLHHHDQQPP